MMQIQHVRIVSPQYLHLFMIPEASSLPFTFEFCGPRCNADFLENDPPITIDIVVQPHSHNPIDLRSRPHQQIWWFFDSLSDSYPIELAGQRHLLADADAALRRRQSSVLQTAVELVSVVVPDEDSSSWLRERGFDSIVLPPPVNEKLFEVQAGDNPSILTLGSPTPYGNLFVEAIKPRVVNNACSPDQQATLEYLSEFSTGFNSDADARGGFSYQSAVHLSAGHALITPTLRPSHGFEPGIDYFDVSSPEELHHTVEYLTRNPEVLHLMRYRGRQKARYFRALTVWDQLFKKLGL